MLNDATNKEKIIGTFSVPKLLNETEEVQLQSYSTSEIKNISDHKKQVSKTEKMRTPRIFEDNSFMI